MKEIFNWIWIEILVIAILKNSKKFLMFMGQSKKKFVFNMQKQYISHKTMGPPRLFVDIHITNNIPCHCFYMKTPGGRNDSLPYRRRRRKERKETQLTSSSKTYFCCLRVCYVFSMLSEWNTSSTSSSKTYFCCLWVCYVFSMLCEWNTSSTSSSFKTFVVFEYVMCFQC